MAPSVRPAARLSERPLFTVVGEAVQAAAGTGVRCESGRRRTPAGSASPEMRAMRLLRHRHREVATRRRASFPRRLHVAPSSGVEPAGGLRFRPVSRSGSPASRVRRVVVCLPSDGRGPPPDDPRKLRLGVKYYVIHSCIHQITLCGSWYARVHP